MDWENGEVLELERDESHQKTHKIGCTNIGEWMIARTPKTESSFDAFSILTHLPLLNSQQQQFRFRIHLHLPLCHQSSSQCHCLCCLPTSYFPSLTNPTTTVSSNDTAVTVTPTLSTFYFVEVRIGLPRFTVTLAFSTSSPTTWVHPHVAKTATAADPCRYDLGFNQGILGIDTLSLVSPSSTSSPPPSLKIKHFIFGLVNKTSPFRRAQSDSRTAPVTLLYKEAYFSHFDYETPTYDVCYYNQDLESITTLTYPNISYHFEGGAVLQLLESQAFLTFGDELQTCMVMIPKTGTEPNRLGALQQRGWIFTYNLHHFALNGPKIKSFIFKDGGGLEVDEGDTNDKVSIPKIPCLKPRSYRHRESQFHGEPWKPNSDLNKVIGRECQRNGDGSVIGRHGGGGDSKAGESKRLGGRGSDSEKKIGGEGEMKVNLNSKLLLL
ncbi:hypothetical protein ACFX11_009549 [Malus domestica]